MGTENNQQPNIIIGARYHLLPSFEEFPTSLSLPLLAFASPRLIGFFLGQIEANGVNLMAGHFALSKQPYLIVGDDS